jgi:Ca2+-transporting ATPase
MLKNRLLNISFVVGIALVLLPVLIPGLGKVFGATPLSLVEWLVAVACAVAIVPIVEIQKAVERAIDKKKKRK